MNLWVRKSGLIILSALALFGCEEELSTVGLPPENNLGIFFVDVPLGDNVSQVWIDNVNSRGTGKILVGSYEDEYFGHIEARNFSELTLPSTDPGADLPETIEFDSLVLEARIRATYGGSTAPTMQKVEIYQLTDTIPVTSEFFTTASSQALGQKLAESEFLLDPDSVGFTFEDSGRDEHMDAADSAYRENFFDSDDVYIYKSTFRINDAFAQDFFTRMKNSDEAFKSSDAFAGYMKGIAFVPAATNSAVITYEAAETKMVLYYTETDDDGNVSFKTLSFGVSSGLSYNNIQPNNNVGWSGSDFDYITSFYEPYQTESELAYLQSGTNLLLKLDLSSFNEFADTVDNAIIQNAELIFSNIQSASGVTPPPSNMAYYLTSTDSLANENYRVNALRSDNRSFLIANYNEEDNEVRSNITLSLQDLLEEETYNQLIVAPTLVNSNGLLRPDGANVNRMIVAKDDISIRFYYTIPDNN